MLVALVFACVQTPSVVDLNPVQPPTASWPVFVDVAGAVSSPGTVYADVGSGRGQALVDLVGPDPSDPGNPNKVGPPDGLLDLVQTNSNSPGMPLGAPPSFWVVPPIGTQQLPCQLLRQEPGGTWTDVAGVLSAGSPTGFSIEFPGGSPWGVSAADYDADGDADLFYPCGGFNTASPNALMRNEGDGSFTNVSAAALIQGVQASFAGAWFDADMDGDLDLYEANAGILLQTYYTGPLPDPTDKLYRNNGDGTFTDVATQAGTNLRSSSFSVGTGDLDLDGDTDLVISCFKMFNKAFYSNGDGTFSFMAPAGNPNWSFTLADLQPLVTIASNPPSEDFGALAPGMDVTLPSMARWSMPVEIVDVNGDQWPDVLMVNWASQLVDDDPLSALGAMFTHAEAARLYLNRGDQDGDGVGDGEFREVAAEVGFEHIGGAMGMVVADFNGDGMPDIYVGGGGPDLPTQLEEDYLYINEPTAWPDNFQQDPDQPLGRAFYEIGALAGTYGNNYMCHGLTAFRNGGRLDALVGNGGPAIFDSGQANVYYQNNGNADGQPYQLFDVELIPTTSVPGAFGSRVAVIRDGDGGAGQVLVREQSGGARFASHNTGPLTFGLGQSEALFVGVRWQSGVHQGQLLWPAPTPETLTLTEGEVSLALNPSYPVGMGLDLDLKLATENPAGVTGALFFALLVPLPGGGFAPNTITLALPSISATPGAPFEASGTISNPQTGLYAFALVDLGTGEVINTAAVWHDPELETPALPASASTGERFGWIPSLRSLTPSWSAPSTLEPVGQGLRLRADAVEIAPARLPLAFETLDTRGSGERLLDGGDRCAGTTAGSRSTPSGPTAPPCPSRDPTLC